MGLKPRRSSLMFAMSATRILPKEFNNNTCIRSWRAKWLPIPHFTYYEFKHSHTSFRLYASYTTNQLLHIFVVFNLQRIPDRKNDRHNSSSIDAGNSSECGSFGVSFCSQHIKFMLRTDIMCGFAPKDMCRGGAHTECVAVIHL